MQNYNETQNIFNGAHDNHEASKAKQIRKNKEAQDDRKEKQNDQRRKKPPPKKQTPKSNKNVK